MCAPRQQQANVLHTLHSPPTPLQEYFIKYYDSCMPLMTNILTHASGGVIFDFMG